MPDKRTTVRLNEPLLRRVQAYARRHSLTFTAVMERALDAYVAKPASHAGAGTKWKLPAAGAGGLKRGVSLDKTSDLLALLERGEPIEKLR